LSHLGVADFASALAGFVLRRWGWGWGLLSRVGLGFLLGLGGFFALSFLSDAHSCCVFRLFAWSLHPVKHCAIHFNFFFKS
jgi:hypothetical protein